MSLVSAATILSHLFRPTLCLFRFQIHSLAEKNSLSSSSCLAYNFVLPSLLYFYNSERYLKQFFNKLTMYIQIAWEDLATMAMNLSI